MVDHIKSILNELEMPYRILKLCSGDLGFTSALTYDVEIYSTAQKRWLEISSVSTFNNFQAERLKLRFKDVQGKKQTHSLVWWQARLKAILIDLRGRLEQNYLEQFHDRHKQPYPCW